MKEAKTKLVAGLLKKLGGEGRVLIVLDAPNASPDARQPQHSRRRGRAGRDLNAYDVLRCKKLVITQPALEKLGARWN